MTFVFASEGPSGTHSVKTPSVPTRDSIRRLLVIRFSSWRSTAIIPHTGAFYNQDYRSASEYHLTVLSKPSRNATIGSYPRIDRAADKSASESFTSPARAGSYTGVNSGRPSNFAIATASSLIVTRRPQAMLIIAPRNGFDRFVASRF